MEEDDFNFGTELLTLEDMAAIAIASRLGLRPYIKKEVQYFLEISYCFPSYVLEKTLVELTAKISEIIIQDLNHVQLPGVLKTKIQEKAVEMCEQIFYWAMYLNKDLELDFKHVEKIYWTSNELIDWMSNGLIDEDKMFKFFWMKFPTLTLEGEMFDKNLKFLYYLACFSAQEEFITNFQMNIMNELNGIFPLKVESSSDAAVSILKDVIYYYDKFDVWKPMDYAERCRCNRSPPSNSQVLDSCISRGLYKSFVYIWNRSDIVERSLFIEERSKINLKRIMKVMFAKENSLKIVLFLVNEMNATQKEDFVLRNLEYFIPTFLQRKPFHKFCIPLLDKFLPQLVSEEFENRGYVSSAIDLLDSVAKKLRYFNKENLHLYFKVLKFLMKKHSKEHKHVFAVVVENMYNVTREIFCAFDIPMLKSIINDKDLQDWRDDIIRCGSYKYMNLIRCNNLQLLNEFMDEVLTSESERNKFKQDFNFLEEWIKRGKFDVVDRVLDWLHGDEARTFKIQMNHLCCRLIWSNYDLIDNLLKWYFETEKEPLIENCSSDKSLSLKEFCRELIYNMWFRLGDKYAAEIVSKKILKCAFGSEEQIADIKHKVLAADESCVRFFCEELVERDGFYEFKVFSILDHFFNFCTISPVKIDAIKKLIESNVNDWIWEYGVRINRCTIVAPLLNWIYGSESDNFEKLKTHFPDPEIVVSYYKICFPELYK